MDAIRVRDLDGRIHELGLGADGRFTDPHGEVDLIDASDGYAIAGLVDAHAHLSADSLESMVTGVEDLEHSLVTNARHQIEGGVLLVADKGGRDARHLQAFDIDPRERPELRMAGALLTTAGGYYEGFGRPVDPDADLRDEVEEVADERTQWVKVIGDWPRRGLGPSPNFSVEAMRQIVETAHRGGRRVAIHATAPGTSSMAVEAGIDSVEHGLFITETDLQILGARGGAWVPTIAAMESIRDVLGIDSTGGRLFQEGLDNVRNLLGPAVQAGVRLLAGTDLALPHGGVATEAVRMVEYGLDAQTAVAALTEDAYTYFDVGRTFSVGSIADVVVLAGDPREDIEHLVAPRLVIRAGRLIRGG